MSSACDGTKKRPYPYMQFMDPEWLSWSSRQGRQLWLVAKEGTTGQVMGCISAKMDVVVANQMRKNDGSIVQMCAVLVSHQWHHRGVGSSLLSAMSNALLALEDVSFVFGRVRAHASGGNGNPVPKLMQEYMFQLCGIEPFVHFVGNGA